MSSRVHSECGRNRRQGLAGVLLALVISLSGAVWPGKAAQALPDVGGGADQQRVNALYCSDLLFRTLPGSFNFCLGERAWEKGKVAQAIEWMELAAGWGNKLAQRFLGLTYFNGQGVPPDRALGLAWLSLAAERESPEAVMLFKSAWHYASTSEKQRAKTLLDAMRMRYADDVAAKRADRRLQRELAKMTSNPVYGVGWCFYGPGAAADPRTLIQDDSSSGLSGPETPRGCSLASEEATIRAIRVYSDRYFEGWQWHVTVGELERADK